MEAEEPDTMNDSFVGEMKADDQSFPGDDSSGAGGGMEGLLSGNVTDALIQAADFIARNAIYNEPLNALHTDPDVFNDEGRGEEEDVDMKDVDPEDSDESKQRVQSSSVETHATGPGQVQQGQTEGSDAQNGGEEIPNDEEEDGPNADTESDSSNPEGGQEPDGEDGDEIVDGVDEKMEAKILRARQKSLAVVHETLRQNTSKALFFVPGFDHVDPTTIKLNQSLYFTREDESDLRQPVHFLHWLSTRVHFSRPDVTENDLKYEGTALVQGLHKILGHRKKWMEHECVKLHAHGSAAWHTLLSTCQVLEDFCTFLVQKPGSEEWNKYLRMMDDIIKVHDQAKELKDFWDLSRLYGNTDDENMLENIWVRQFATNWRGKWIQDMKDSGDNVWKRCNEGMNNPNYAQHPLCKAFLQYMGGFTIDLVFHREFKGLKKEEFKALKDIEVQLPYQQGEGGQAPVVAEGTQQGEGEQAPVVTEGMRADHDKNIKMISDCFSFKEMEDIVTKWNRVIFRAVMTYPKRMESSVKSTGIDPEKGTLEHCLQGIQEKFKSINTVWKPRVLQRTGSFEANELAIEGDKQHLKQTLIAIFIMVLENIQKELTRFQADWDKWLKTELPPITECLNDLKKGVGRNDSGKLTESIHDWLAGSDFERALRKRVKESYIERYKGAIMLERAALKRSVDHKSHPFVVDMFTTFNFGADWESSGKRMLPVAERELKRRHQDGEDESDDEDSDFLKIGLADLTHPLNQNKQCQRAISTLRSLVPVIQALKKDEKALSTIRTILLGRQKFELLTDGSMNFLVEEDERKEACNDVWKCDTFNPKIKSSSLDCVGGGAPGFYESCLNFVKNGGGVRSKEIFEKLAHPDITKDLLNKRQRNSRAIHIFVKHRTGFRHQDTRFPGGVFACVRDVLNPWSNSSLEVQTKKSEIAMGKDVFHEITRNLGELIVPGRYTSAFIPKQSNNQRGKEKKLTEEELKLWNAKQFIEKTKKAIVNIGRDKLKMMPRGRQIRIYQKLREITEFANGFASNRSPVSTIPEYDSVEGFCQMVIQAVKDKNVQHAEDLLQVIQDQNILEISRMSCFFSEDGTSYGMSDAQWGKSIREFFPVKEEKRAILKIPNPEGKTDGEAGAHHGPKRLFFCAKHQTTWRVSGDDLDRLYTEKINLICNVLGPQRVLSLMKSWGFLSSMEEFHMKLSMITADCTALTQTVASCMDFLLSKFGCDKWVRDYDDMVGVRKDPRRLVKCRTGALLTFQRYTPTPADVESWVKEMKRRDPYTRDAMIGTNPAVEVSSKLDKDLFYGDLGQILNALKCVFSRRNKDSNPASMGHENMDDEKDVSCTMSFNVMLHEFNHHLCMQ